MLKKSAPTIKVKIGVSEFNIPVNELASPCSAKGKSEAGIKFAINPSARNFFQFLVNVFLNWKIATGKRERKAKEILKLPTSKGVKASNPLFIKMN